MRNLTVNEILNAETFEVVLPLEYFVKYGSANIKGEFEYLKERSRDSYIDFINHSTLTITFEFGKCSFQISEITPDNKMNHWAPISTNIPERFAEAILKELAAGIAIITNIDLGAKLHDFTFDVDEKVIMWVRSNITVKARNYEEAVNFIKTSDVEQLYDLTSDKKKIPLWDSMETMRTTDCVVTDDNYHSEATIIFLTETGGTIRTNED